YRTSRFCFHNRPSDEESRLALATRLGLDAEEREVEWKNRREVVREEEQEAKPLITPMRKMRSKSGERNR
ncbi:MAG: hypothetical protein ACLFNP_12870, partial [Spirochaetaceae bacterium]